MKLPELERKLVKTKEKRDLHLKNINWMDENQVRKYHEINIEIDNLQTKIKNIKRGNPINGLAGEFKWDSKGRQTKD